MTGIVCKQGVVFAGFSPALVRILLALIRLSERYTVMVTSASDGQHQSDSWHYRLAAVDLRTRQFTTETKARFLSDLRKELGPRFTVLLEHEGEANEHAHIQPRKGSTYTLEHLRQVCAGSGSWGSSA